MLAENMKVRAEDGGGDGREGDLIFFPFYYFSTTMFDC